MPSILQPITARSALSLNDAAAKAPVRLRDADWLRDDTARAEAELGKLQSLLFADKRYALLVVLQGRDAAGKDGTIKHVFDGCNPQGCRVTSFGVPTAIELAHDYLWRVHAAVPPKGFIGIFNRSHYEDVLVVRVRSLVPKKIWSKRYEEINQFERTLNRSGVIILKFFLHVSRAEQRKRFIDRLTDEKKNWKFRAGDLDDRAKWPAYTRAYRDMLRLCSTPWAPWYVVPADNKAVRNYLITRTINETLRGLRLQYPRASKDVLRLIHQIH